MASLDLDVGELVPLEYSMRSGESIALDTIRIAITFVLSVHNISKEVDSHENVITPELKLHSGVVRPAPQTISIQSAFLTSC